MRVGSGRLLCCKGRGADVAGGWFDGLGGRLSWRVCC